MLWTAPAFLDEFAELLRDRPNLDGVKVHTAPVEQLGAGKYIVFTRVPGEQRWAALGAGRKQDNYTVNGSIYVMATKVGETGAVEVRNAARDLLLEVAAQIMALARDQTSFVEDIGGVSLTELNLANVSIDGQGVADDTSRDIRVTFEIEVAVRIATT